LYSLEAYGGGSGSSIGAYAIRYVELTAGKTIYIVTGASGDRCYTTTSSTGSDSAAGGYNGGGSSFCTRNSYTTYAYSGGGATHIATVSGLLSNLSAYKDTGEILVVAGGAGGNAVNGSYGVTGGNGRGYSTDGYQFGLGSQGSTGNARSGGGGGWYGGVGGYTRYTGSSTSIYRLASQGGSSYIGVAADTSTITYNGVTYTSKITAGGANTGYGKAIITLIAKPE